MSTHIFFDLSALLWHAERLAPRGVDRVELAYAKHLITTARDRLSFVGWWGRLGLLPDDHAVALVEALDALWSASFVDPAERYQAAAIARRLRLHVLLRGERSLYLRARCAGQRLVYLLVTYRLHRPPAIERFKERTGARFVCFVHDLIPIELPEHVRWFHTQLHRRRMNSVAQLADLVIVNSADTGAAFRRRFVPVGRTTPVVVAPLGIDLGAATCVHPAASDRPYFICIAAVEPRKNHRLLLDVWHRLAVELGVHAPRLILVGRRGWKNKEIVDTIKRSPTIRSLVDEYNALPDAAVARLLVGACALLYPSLAEGFGLPVAEALALGVPVLCSDLPALREVGREVPEYLDPHDPGGWREAILDYGREGSPRRQAQLTRLSGWHPPSWEEHFKLLQPLIDGLPLLGNREADIAHRSKDRKPKGASENNRDRHRSYGWPRSL